MHNGRQHKNGSIIKVICDNYTTREDVEASWGFSCLIRNHGQTILFDTGSDGVVLEHNMARLGVDPASLDLLMISHQHWDHTGGIYDILNANRNLRVCVPRSFSAHFKSDMKRYGAQIMEVKKAREILPGFFTTGELEGILPEQAALVRTSAGTVVITGCAHPGIVSIVETAKKILPKDDIALVMGGFHLLDDSDDDILQMIARFKDKDVRYAAASHCSGERARNLFAREYGDHFIYLGAGSVITLEDIE
ncbi:MAG: MBL fold metallo-hydrolase [Smithella sp.]|jgi:7,8-dihydropterin-6-yl-methyl-4-(beta-D-ribofuranosyl)aminobenzene 5'-phosphate synthase|nr:MBL fold metallo-hydrolase [Smithella sp.]MDD5523895.1 MBL fold metallo-hydrolase [Smithella sp.]